MKEKKNKNSSKTNKSVTGKKAKKEENIPSNKKSEKKNTNGKKTQNIKQVENKSAVSKEAKQNKSNEKISKKKSMFSKGNEIEIKNEENKVNKENNSPISKKQKVDKGSEKISKKKSSFSNRLESIKEEIKVKKESTNNKGKASTSELKNEKKKNKIFMKNTANNSPKSVKNNSGVKNSKSKSKFKKDEIREKLLLHDDKILSSINKSKETISTLVETLPTEENKRKESQTKSPQTAEEYTGKRRKNKRRTVAFIEHPKAPLEENEKNEENKSEDDNNYKSKRRLSTHEIDLTPIPMLRRKKGQEIDLNNKDVQNAIVLRRLEYNDYIKSLNKPKNKPKPKPKPKPRPKYYDQRKVNYIQKMYKAFQARVVNQILNRKKVNLCVTELFCLLLSENYNHAVVRIAFALIKLYYHEPFCNIDDEVDFSDKLYMKLSDKYYNFNNIKFSKHQKPIEKRRRKIKKRED